MVVTNTAGAVTSTAATLTVTPAAVAPQITTQPTDQSVTVGGSATFTVTATGAPTPTYQWRFDGSEISGATSSSYTISSAALTNAGDYTVVVTNTAGAVTSTAATLTVTPAAVAPQITTQPTDQSVTVGGSATFTVTATGAPTPTYQWRFEGSEISGATSSSYAVSSAALTNAGDYTVVVTNTAGAVTSTAATLTVTPAAEITTEPTKPSILIEPRRIGAGAALRRHVDRFDSLTGALVRSRLAGCTTRRLSASENLGRGAAATGGRFGETGWCGWLDGAWAGFDGKATGRQADIYGGVDYRSGSGSSGGDWLIGALIGYERADLEIGKATYSADYIHFGLYGGARLSERLLFDAAATYGLAAGGGPTVALGGVSASYDAWRLTVRAGLTGDIGLEYGLWNGTVRIEPRVGVLYARETLGAFTDSAGGVAGREVLELGRFSAGPRLTWDFAGDFAGRFIGGQLVVGGRAQWDFLRLEDGVGGRVSGAADIGLRLVLAPGVALGLYGNIDGIGTIGDFISYGGRVTLDLRF